MTLNTSSFTLRHIMPLAAALLLICAPASAQLVGGRFQIGQPHWPTSPPQVSAGDNVVVIAWTEERQVADRTDIFAQRFDPLGTAIGPEFRVNTMTSDYQYLSALAVAADGRFVVFWYSTSDRMVHGQLYDADAVMVGGEFTLSTQGSQLSATFTPDGGVVVAWAGSTVDGVAGVFAQRFDSFAAPLGAPFQVNISTPFYNAETVVVDSDSTGNFVIVWDDQATTIFGRRFDAGGIPGPELVIDSIPGWTEASLDYIAWPTVDVAPDGSFVIVWESPQAGSADIFARRYSPDGTPSGPRYPVRTGTEPIARPQIALDASGNHVVVWWSSSGVKGRMFDAGAVPIGSEFILATTQSEPRIVSTIPWSCSFIVAWAETVASQTTFFGRRLVIPSDLMISELNGPAVAAPGGSASIRFKILNQSGAPTPLAFNSLYWSTDETVDSSDQPIGFAPYVLGLRSGESTSLTQTVTIPTVAPRYYYVIAAADMYNNAVESNETNNTRVLRIGIGPDLEVSSLTAPLTTARGATITIREFTRNSGGESSGFTRTRLVVSYDGILSANDLTIGTHTIVPLSPGVSYMGTSTFTVPTSLTPGTYSLFAVADSVHEVAEFNESNNIRRVTIRIY